VARLDNNCYPRAPKRRVAHATTTGHRYAAARPMANRNRYRAARWRIGRRSCSTPCARAPGLPTTMLFGRAESNAFLPLFWRNMDAGTRPRHPPPPAGIAVPPGHASTPINSIGLFNARAISISARTPSDFCQPFSSRTTTFSHNRM